MPKGAPALIQAKYSLALANLQTASPGGVTATPFGGRGPGGIIHAYQGGVGGIGGQGQNIPGFQPSENAALAELRQQVQTMHHDVSKIISHLDEKERQEAEERREAEHRQELREMKEEHAGELARLEAQQKETTERLEKQYRETIERLEKEHKESLASLRQELKPREEPQAAADVQETVHDLSERLRLGEAQAYEKWGPWTAKNATLGCDRRPRGRS